MKLKIYTHLLTVSLGLAILLITVITLAATPAIPDFSQYTEGKERKVVFFNYFRPLIDQRNHAIRNIRQRIQTWYQDRKDLGWWASMQVVDVAKDYGIAMFDSKNEKHWHTLLKRVDIIPTSLALAQAALESAWGTSRFARETHNYFGQWCFKKGCGVVPENRTPGTYHEVADFDSPEHAVISYIHNLNSYSAYKPLRDIRAQLRAENKPVTGIALARGLVYYSERRADYVKELRAIMLQNKLSQYDLAQTDAALGEID